MQHNTMRLSPKEFFLSQVTENVGGIYIFIKGATSLSWKHMY